MRRRRDALEGLAMAMELLRHQKAEMPMQQAHMLLMIAKRPGITTIELTEALGLAQSSGSRNLMALGSRHRQGRMGLGLVRIEDDPSELRRHVVFLTDDGKAFVTRLLRCFDPSDCYDRETAYRMSTVESMGTPKGDGSGRLNHGPAPS